MAEKAKILFDKFIAGTCSKQEFEELMALLQDNKSEAYFKRMLNAVYQSVDRSMTSNVYISKQGDLLYAEKPGTKPMWSIKKRLATVAVAASLLLMVGIGWQFLLKEDSHSVAKKAVATIVLPVLKQDGIKQNTARAEQKHLLLPDGTQVWLNAESSLEIPKKFDNKLREVYLSGEAFFDVKHADKIPFIIHTANNVTTRVLGTAFDIKAYANQEVTVSVKRGLVKVSKDDKLLATLSLGQQINIATHVDAAPEIKKVKEKNIASWTVGKLIYDGMSFEDIVEDLQRVYNVQITLESTKLRNELITSSFNQGDGLETVLKTLCVLTSTSYIKENNKYLIK